MFGVTSADALAPNKGGGDDIHRNHHRSGFDDLKRGGRIFAVKLVVARKGSHGGRGASLHEIRQVGALLEARARPLDAIASAIAKSMAVHQFTSSETKW